MSQNFSLLTQQMLTGLPVKPRLLLFKLIRNTLVWVELNLDEVYKQQIIKKAIYELQKSHVHVPVLAGFMR